jgi:hypothetical protein
MKSHRPSIFGGALPVGAELRRDRTSAGARSRASEKIAPAIQRSSDAHALCVPCADVQELSAEREQAEHTHKRLIDHPQNGCADAAVNSPSPDAALGDRAILKERDENVRFKQSVTPHVSREGPSPRWKLEANGDASRLIPRLVGFVCGFGSCGDLLIETLRPRAHRDAPWGVSALPT